MRSQGTHTPSTFCPTMLHSSTPACAPCLCPLHAAVAVIYLPGPSYLRSTSVPDAQTDHVAFHGAHLDRPIHGTSSLQVQIRPKIGKGFAFTEGIWLGYRRNYFQVSSTFVILDSAKQAVQPSDAILASTPAGLVPVSRFAFSLASRCSDGEDSAPVDIVQRTAKREKGPQTTPPRLFCSPLPSIDTAPHDAPAGGAVVYERLQFRNTTIAASRRRFAAQYHFVSVQLWAVLDDGSEIIVATTETVPLVVRSRSPRHYMDNDSGDFADTTPTSPVTATTPPRLKLRRPGESGWRTSSSGLPGLNSPAQSSAPLFSPYPQSALLSPRIAHIPRPDASMLPPAGSQGMLARQQSGGLQSASSGSLPSLGDSSSNQLSYLLTDMSVSSSTFPSLSSFVGAPQISAPGMNMHSMSLNHAGQMIFHDGLILPAKTDSPSTPSTGSSLDTVSSNHSLPHLSLQRPLVSSMYGKALSAQPMSAHPGLVQQMSMFGPPTAPSFSNAFMSTALGTRPVGGNGQGSSHSQNSSQQQHQHQHQYQYQQQQQHQQHSHNNMMLMGMNVSMPMPHISDAHNVFSVSSQSALGQPATLATTMPSSTTDYFSHQPGASKPVP
ncbi:hypothetical protein BC831DRAFT_448141 [Entophlyctis helioformis]|nr:hypothetical protein BC831DRAFT_448141 [Entophlyctis helioformis]